MIKKSLTRSFALMAALTGAFLLTATDASAQRDPFKKAGWATPKKPVTATSKPGAGAKPAPTPFVYTPPTIEARIDYYKRAREQAAANGTPLPKVTSVLTLNEMTVSGIFKTPRGYAAMVEATPINLSYTIYPGEKFFDGQLVAVEENRLVFRKVTKVGEGKFVSSVENKALRQFSMKAQVQGTAPTQGADKPVEVASNNPPPADTKPAPADTNPAPVETKPVSTSTAKPSGNPFLSPLDEMNSLPAEPAKDSSKGKGKTPAKKPTKVARANGN